MTQEEKRIKLAETEGWTKIREQDYDHGCSGDDIRQFWVGLSPNTGDMEQIPDYFNDLNAVRSLWSKLTIAQGEVFAHYLAYSYMPNGYIGYIELPAKDVFAPINSPAEVQAEALGKTLNLW